MARQLADEGAAAGVDLPAIALEGVVGLRPATAARAMDQGVESGDAVVNRPSFPGTGTGLTIRGIAIDPADHEIAYVANGNDVYVTTDAEADVLNAGTLGRGTFRLEGLGSSQ